MEETPPPPLRWRWVLLALAAVLVVPAVPFFRVLLPVEQLVLLLAPAFAVCAMLGWGAGGRLSLAVVWLVAAGWIVSQPLPGIGGYDDIARGWALLLAASFGGVGLLRRETTFTARALSAIAVGLVVALAMLVVAQVPPGDVQQTFATEYARRVEEWSSTLQRMTSSPEWQEYASGSPEAVRLIRQAEVQLRQLPVPSAVIFPAMLALESMALLALAWALYQRIGRVHIGPPLVQLRAFRFNDQLIWGLIVGITTLVVPGLSELRPLGINLLVFFGALYVVRGFGVLMWILAPGRLAMVLLVGLALLAWPLLGAFALGLGVGDTWLDWRSRPRRTS